MGLNPALRKEIPSGNRLFYLLISGIAIDYMTNKLL